MKCFTKKTSSVRIFNRNEHTVGVLVDLRDLKGVCRLGDLAMGAVLAVLA